MPGNGGLSRSHKAAEEAASTYMEQILLYMEQDRLLMSLITLTKRY